MSAPVMKTLRVTLVDLETTPGGPNGTFSGEVWARLTKQIRSTDGQVIPFAKVRKVIPSTGTVDIEVPANNDAGIHADDHGFGVVVGWDLTGDGKNGTRADVSHPGSTILVTSADPDPTLFSTKVEAVPTDALSTYITEAAVDAKIAVIPGISNASSLTSGTLADARLPATSNAAAVAANGTAVYVKAHGAVANGTTDDTAAIAAAITSAKALAGLTGHAITVQLMAGTHVVDFAAQADAAGYYAGIELSSNVHLRGMGIGATVVKLKAAATPGVGNSGAIIRNATLTAGGDNSITISDMEIDGNGATSSILPIGIAFVRAQSLRVERVRVRNVRGTAAYPPGETFHFSTDGCGDVTYVDCEAIGTAGTQGSGFGDNSSTNVRYVGCTARGMSAGMGFASWHGNNITFDACYAYLNGANGINVEYGLDVILTGCHTGGKASSQSGGYIFANNAVLGNASAGIIVNASQRVTVSACHSNNNATGIGVVSTGSDHSSVRVLGGYYCENTARGISFGNAACALGSYVSRETVSVGNTANANWEVNDGVVGIIDNPDSTCTPFALPTSGTVYTNPYPFPVTIFVFNAFTGINVGGVQMAGAGALACYPLGVGETTAIYYSAAPVWVWKRQR